MDYSVLAYYVLYPFDNPKEERDRHEKFLRTLDSKGRIYIASQGVNAQLSLNNKDVEAYLSFLEKDERYKEADVKIHPSSDHAFHKLSVKLRKELVAINQEVDLTKRGAHLSPKEWREAMEKGDPNTIVLDVRNNYESCVGYFEGAIRPDIETFREFPAFAKELSAKIDPSKTRVLMYCTGGIRCELYSPLLKDLGFKEILQLKGGVIRYGLEEGEAHWRGKLFVFDDRLVIPISKENKETITLCRFCQTSADTYYNCANMDCNSLMLACSSCVEKERGCCQESCKAGRVRSIETKIACPKPFRKLSFDEKQKL
jgi:UPF0176 protein